MKSFYKDDEKIDIVEAERIVRRYVEEKGRLMSSIRPNQVMKESDIPNRRHNYIRIERVLDERCEQLEGHSDKTFRMPDPDEIDPFPTTDLFGGVKVGTD